MPKILKRVAAPPGELKPSDLWRTPKNLFAALDAEFDFCVDLAANTDDHLCEYWLGPGAFHPDALKTRWLSAQIECGDIMARPTGFLNPPYSSSLIRLFMAKAAAETEYGFTTVALVPYTPDTQWWQCTYAAAEIREIPHRVGYLKADGHTKAHAMFPSAVVIFRPQPGIVRGEPRRVVWDYRD